jgi:hypothetical protein
MGWHGDAIGLSTDAGFPLVAGTPSTKTKQKQKLMYL